MPIKPQDQVNSNTASSDKKQHLFALRGGGEADGKGESYKQQQYIEKVFTCVLWRNFSNATVEYSIFRNDAGKGDKTEHQDKNDKIQQDQKTQEGEVRLDASAKLP